MPTGAPCRLGRRDASYPRSDGDRRTAETSAERAASSPTQRRALPDQPGVYLFRDGAGACIYVGKAKSVRKRVASHFSKAQVPSSPGTPRWSRASRASSASSSPPRPRRCSPSRASSSSTGRASTSACATTSPTRSSRSRSTRSTRACTSRASATARARLLRPVLERQARARRRSRCSRRCSCSAPAPAPSRGGAAAARAWTTTSSAARRPASATSPSEEYRAAIDGVDRLPLGPLPRDRARPRAAHARGRGGRGVRAGDASSATGCAPCARCSSAGAWPNESVGTFDAVAVARRRARGQRAGLPGARRRALRPPVLLPLERDRARRWPRSPRSSCSSTTAGTSSIPALLVVQRELGERPALADALASRRGGPVELRAAERGEKRRILELAERNARLALDQERLRSERRRQSRVEALEGLQQALGLDAPPIRIECFDISNLGGTHTVASMVVFEGGAPKKSDYRRFKIRTRRGRARRLRRDGRGARAALRAVGAPGRHLPARPRLRRELRRAAEPRRDRRRQGPAGRRARRRCAAFASAASRSSRWPSGSRRCSCPGRRAPLVLDHSTPELQLLQRVRDEAHRFAITHHRSRRDRAMTSSLLDELPGVGPARKRALLAHFGSPEAVARGLAARSCRRCPGCPAKVGRELHALPAPRRAERRAGDAHASRARPRSAAQ